MRNFKLKSLITNKEISELLDVLVWDRLVFKDIDGYYAKCKITMLTDNGKYDFVPQPIDNSIFVGLQKGDALIWLTNQIEMLINRTFNKVFKTRVYFE